MRTIALKSPPDDPVLAGKLLDDIRRSAPAGSVIEIPGGVYELPCGSVYVPPTPKPYTAIVGTGPTPEATVLFQRPFSWSGRDAAFEFSHGLIYENLTLATPTGEDARGVQMITAGYTRQNSGNQTTTLRNVIIRGATCGLYSWGADGQRNRVVWHGGRCEGTRWLVSIGQSNGADAAYYDLHGVDIVGDWQQYGPGAGHTERHMMAGLLARGGRIRMFGGSITLKGGTVLTTDSKPLVEMIGATTTNIDSGSQWGGGVWPLIELHSVPPTKFENVGSARAIHSEAVIGRITDG